MNQSKKEQSFNKKVAAEKKAMKWFDEKKSTTFNPQKNKHSRFDGYLISGQTEFITEVKVRKKYTSEQIESFGGSFLEFKKLSGIINYKNDNNALNRILYFCFYKDKLNIYSISSNPNDYKWELKWLQRNDYDYECEWKHVVKLKKEDLIETIKYN